MVFGDIGLDSIGVEWSRACKLKVREIQRMLEHESQRLQAVATACDQLKASATAKIKDLAMTFNEVVSHQDYVDKVRKTYFYTISRFFTT